MIKKIFKIVDMHCTSCSLSIDGDLEDTEGVQKSQTSYAKQITEVTFDEKKIKPEQLIKIIKKTGYTAEVV